MRRSKSSKFRTALTCAFAFCGSMLGREAAVGEEIVYPLNLERPFVIAQSDQRPGAHEQRAPSNSSTQIASTSADPSPHGVWLGSYTCGQGTFPLELVINVSPKRPEYPARSVHAVVSFDFAAGGTVKRASVVMSGEYGPNMKRLRLASHDRDLVRPAELRDVLGYDGDFTISPRQLKLQFRGAPKQCRILSIAESEKPTLYADAWAQVEEPSVALSRTAETRENGATTSRSSPARSEAAPRSTDVGTVDISQCQGNASCHPLVGSWIGEASCASRSFAFQLDFGPDNDITTAERVSRGGSVVGTKIRGDLLYSERGRGRGSIRYEGWAGQEVELDPVPSSEASGGLLPSRLTGRLTDYDPGHLTLKFEKPECQLGFLTLKRATPHLEVLRRQAVLDRERKAVTGDWSGVLSCRNKLLPIEVSISQNNTSYRATVDVGGRSYAHSLGAPSRAPGKLQALDVLLETEGRTQPELGRLRALAPREGWTRYVIFELDTEKMPSLPELCQGNRQTLFLAKRPAKAFASGAYAEAGAFPSTCRVIGQWIAPGIRHLKSLESIKASYPVLHSRHAAAMKAVALLEASNLNSLFGVDVSSTTTSALVQLSEEARDCAILSDDDELSASIGRFILNDGSGALPRLRDAMRSGSSTKWRPGELALDIDFSAANAGADRQAELASQLKNSFEAWAATGGYVVGEFISANLGVAGQLDPTALLQLIGEFDAKVAPRLAEAEQTAFAARIATEVAAREGKLAECRSRGGPGAREPTPEEIRSAVRAHLLASCTSPQLLWEIFRSPDNAPNEVSWIGTMASARAEVVGDQCRLTALMYAMSLGVTNASPGSCSRTGGVRFACTAGISFSCQSGTISGYNRDAPLAQMACLPFAGPATLDLSLEAMPDCDWKVVKSTSHQRN